MKIKPLGARVLLEVPEKREERTSGGIYIPESAQEDKKEGLVVAAGVDKEGKDLPLKRGDKVLYGGYSSEEFELNGKKHLLIEYKDIMAQIEEE